jgi:hypothetical protein
VHIIASNSIVPLGFVNMIHLQIFTSYDLVQFFAVDTQIRKSGSLIPKRQTYDHGIRLSIDTQFCHFISR